MGVADGLLDGHDLVVDEAVLPGEECTAVDDHVDLVGAGRDRVLGVGKLDVREQRAQRERGRDAGDLDRPAGAVLAEGCAATATRSGYTQTAATDGAVGSDGSGRSALAHNARTLPGVSWPSSVVRSIIRIARSSAKLFASS